MLGCVFPSVSVGLRDLIFNVLIKTEYLMLAQKEIRLLTKLEVKIADIDDVMLV